MSTSFDGVTTPFDGFEPGRARTLVEPAVGEPGHWVGAPALCRYDGALLLALRRRTPDRRGYVLELHRAGADPLDFGGYERLTTVEPGGIGGVSLERAALVSRPDGRLSVLIGVDRGENDWVIARLPPVAAPEDLTAAGAETALAPRPGTSDAVTVKDPVLVRADGRYWCFYAGHDGTSERPHVATGPDGRRFDERAGPVLGRAGWHDHHVRVAWARWNPDARPERRWVVAYGGSGTDDHGATWNLRTGFAAGPSPTQLVDRTPDEPALVAGADGPVGTAGRSADGDGDGNGDDGPGATAAFRTCRYVDAIAHDGGWFVVGEVARPDGAFELRGQLVPDRPSGPDHGR